MADLTGQILGGRYRVETFLGRGGMSEVYKVFDVQRAVYLAMKVLNTDLAGDQVFMQRFLQEAQALEMLQHPNIVRFYGLVKASGHAFILMDFIDGLTLNKVIGMKKHKHLSMERIVDILRPVCAALYYAHQMGMVHCDIKPANIMIHRNGTVYLADFGIAQMTAVTKQAPISVGTPAYIAPEQLSDQQVTPAADIYSLGVVLYEMLTGGQRPFSGESAKTTGSITKKIIWEKQHLPAPSPRKYNRQISPALEAVVLRCLERDPKQRFSTTLELLYALQSTISSPVESDELKTQIDLPVASGTKVSEKKAHKTQAQSASPLNQSAQVIAGSSPAVEEASLPLDNAVETAPPLRRLAFWGVAFAALALVIIALAGLPWIAQVPGLTSTPALASPLAAAAGMNTTRTPAAPGTPPGSAALESLQSAFTEPAPEDTPTLVPTPTGGSRKIAFASNRGDSIQIWTMDIMNPNDRPTQVTNLPGGACQPAWSPDGTHLAFTTPCKGPSVYYPGATIKIINLEDGSITDLLPKSAGAFDPDWSPDGKTIVYTAIMGEKTEIHAIDLGEDKPRVLSTRGSKNAQPAWSQDGRFIAFISSDERYSDALWLMRPDGGSQELLAHDGAFSEPVWSPDNHTILLSRVKGGFPNLVMFDHNDPARGVVNFLPNTYRMSYSSISPDNHWVVFWTEDTHGTPRVMLANLISRQAELLFNSASRDFQPAWGPN
jgi:serine/threonine protein kinase/Tol biopolymer transport system component